MNLSYIQHNLEKQSSILFILLKYLKLLLKHWLFFKTRGLIQLEQLDKLEQDIQEEGQSDEK